MKEFPKTYDATQHIYYCFQDIFLYKEYVQRFERLLKEEYNDYEKYLNNSTPDAYFKYGPKFNFQQNHAANLSIEFPNTLRKSTFISSWSYFENSLNVLCEVFEYHLSLKVNYKDIKAKGSIIDKAKAYLNNEVHIKFPTTSNWNIIKNLQKLRNKVIHSYSEIFFDEVNILSAIRSLHHLELYPLKSKYIIHLDESFLEYSLDIFTEFYKELLDAVKTV